MQPSRFVQIKSFLALTGFLFGPALIGLGTYGVYRSAGSDNWPTTQGKVIKSDVQVMGTGSRGKSFVLEYAYTVSGQPYTSNTIYFQTNTGKGHYYLPRRSADYGKGKTVKVYYNPSDPAIAVLEPGIPSRVAQALVVGVLWSSLTIWVCFVQPRLGTESKESDESVRAVQADEES